ncbi:MULTISPECIES: pyrimidine dimer DNA glycosylase/endonuclease V [unclassified Nesterenkonia]|uniref:pyrimidine dimer DNA glycosylase/endonuclease V n=1 Tax=unclassified Nesterenkonia TaxID=2629769 RepID=UPI001F4CEB80|nr:MULTISPECIES: pyrimidine dimer DNA glycosylase/endonuclease V [unclassified Nesterenkonia]MCH8559988.1 pyrimidine dimer DNA glycosylase/endonuclease V [Nesterenkonia sp. DZ6]MCH8569928.1 pyrimidine dimer DNA glycosylase/endonuclease V [Nesterenkonia sp. AY15]
MRIWSLDPGYLDRQGLVACWRETLLAQAVLQGRTKGYMSHPQLVRFRAQADPLIAIGAYLQGVLSEASARGYRFDATKISSTGEQELMPVTTGQLLLEWDHLGAKLRTRSPQKAQQNLQALRALRASTGETAVPAAHPMMRVIPGGIEPWERAEPG